MNSHSLARSALSFPASPQGAASLVVIGSSFIAVLALACLAAGLPRPLIYAETGHGLAAFVVLLFSLYAGWVARNNQQQAIQLGETLYLLGYIATIAGLGAVAWQIGNDASLLSKEKVGLVLQRGALALVSTLIGLIGMNILRWHGQSLDSQRHQTDQEARQLAEQLEQVLRKTEKERAETFLHAFQAADLTQQLATLVVNLKAASEGLAAFKTDAQEVRRTWTDTLAGLAGLNGALREFRECGAGLSTSLAGLGKGISEAANLAHTAQSTTTALNQLGAAISELQQTAAALSTGLAPMQAGLANFRMDAEQAMLSWLGVQSGLGSLNAALRQFQELADASMTSWASLAEQLAQLPQLNQAVQSTATALGQLGTAVSQLQQTVSVVQSALAPLSTDLTQAVQVLQERLAKLPLLADAVARFVELANHVAPTMEVLGGTFSDIRNINENLRLAVNSLQSFNEQLNATNTATSSIAANANTLMHSTDTLVEEIRNQVHRLKSLSEDMEKVGQTVQQLAPGMETLRGELATIQQFSARIAELVNTLSQAQETLAGTTTKLREVPAVVQDFMNTTRTLLAEAGKGHRVSDSKP